MYLKLPNVGKRRFNSRQSLCDVQGCRQSMRSPPPTTAVHSPSVRSARTCPASVQGLPASCLVLRKWVLACRRTFSCALVWHPAMLLQRGSQWSSRLRPWFHPPARAWKPHPSSLPAMGSRSPDGPRRPHATAPDDSTRAGSPANEGGVGLDRRRALARAEFRVFSGADLFLLLPQVYPHPHARPLAPAPAPFPAHQQGGEASVAKPAMGRCVHATCFVQRIAIYYSG